MKKADFSTAFSSSSPPKAIFNYKSSSYWVPPWKWKPPKISWLYQYENPKTCCFTPGKLLDPYEITMDSHGFPRCSYGFSYGYTTIIQFTNSSPRPWEHPIDFERSDRRPWRMIACCWKSCCVWTAAPCVMPRASCAERGLGVGMGGFKKGWSSDYKIGILET